MHKWTVVAYFSTYMSYFGTSSLDVSEKVDLLFSVSKINSPEKSDGTPLTSHSSLSRYNDSLSLCLFRCRVQLGTFRELLYLVIWSSVLFSFCHPYPQLFSQPLSVVSPRVQSTVKHLGVENYALKCRKSPQRRKMLCKSTYASFQVRLLRGMEAFYIVFVVINLYRQLHVFW